MTGAKRGWVKALLRTRPLPSVTSISSEIVVQFIAGRPGPFLRRLCNVSPCPCPSLTWSATPSLQPFQWQGYLPQITLDLFLLLALQHNKPFVESKSSAPKTWVEVLGWNVASCPEPVAALIIVSRMPLVSSSISM